MSTRLGIESDSLPGDENNIRRITEKLSEAHYSGLPVLV